MTPLSNVKPDTALSDAGSNDSVAHMNEQLLNDSTGSYKAELVQKLQNDLNNVRTKLAQGAAPDEYKVYEAVNSALKSALKYIEGYGKK